MDLKSVKNLLSRSQRIKTRLSEKSGVGMAWKAKISNGETHEYVFNGIKSEEEFKDDIEAIFVWLWSLKDYVKNYAINKGLPKNWIEEKINLDENLCLSADIANRSKHGSLNNSRSGKYPKLDHLNYEFPDQCLEKITFYAFKVEMDIVKTDKSVLTMNVLDHDGNTVADAFYVLDYSLSAWENIIKELDVIGT